MIEIINITWPTLTFLPTWYGASSPILWNVICGAGSPLDRHRRTARWNSSCWTSLSCSISGLTEYVHDINTTPLNYSVSGKNETKLFFIISSRKLARFWRNLVHSFLNKFATENVNVSHLTWIMSLHYLVKLKMLIAQVLYWVVRKKTLIKFIRPIASKAA